MLEEEFEDTKGVIRIRKSEKDRQHNAFILRTAQETSYISFFLYDLIFRKPRICYMNKNMSN
jgi:hypothetical protein